LKKAVISGDIVAYTSLSTEEKASLEAMLRDLFKKLQSDYKAYIRLVKGDYLECVVSPVDALRVALMIKTYIKSLDLQIDDERDSRIKYFSIFGIRLAIGIGELVRFDTDKGIIDGEAIYFSGRLLNEQHTHNKQKIHIKQSLFFQSPYEALNDNFDALFSLIDTLINKASAKQSKVIFYKLQHKTEAEIAGILGISRSVVNRQSISVGWYALKKALIYYEKLMSE